MTAAAPRISVRLVLSARARAAGRAHWTNVARVLDRLPFQAERGRRNQEGVGLITARRPVRPDLIIERDGLVAVVGAEEHEVASVRLSHEPLQCADERQLSAIWREG